MRWVLVPCLFLRISSHLMDKSSFRTNLKLLGLKIHAKDTSRVLQLLQEEAFHRPRMKRVVDAPDLQVAPSPPLAYDCQPL